VHLRPSASRLLEACVTRTLGEGERLTTVKLGRWAWLSRFDADDYVEVLRPEVDTGDDQSAVSAPAA
jgi:hypothetical protein